MEMRWQINNNITWLRSCSMIILLIGLSSVVLGQGHLKVYTVKDGKMYIQLDKNLPAAELDKFIAQYDLSHLAIKRFIESGFKDSIRTNGWQISMDTKIGFILSKPLFSSDDINDPAYRLIFTADAPPVNALFPVVSNAVVFGYNRFRNKKPFAIRDSVANFFLRGYDKARNVMLAGSFNGWNPSTLPMTRSDSGWVIPVKLVPGKYWYKFIVDGNWIMDEDNRLNENDGLGNTNSVFYFTNTLFRLKGYGNAKKVMLAGSFNNWNEKELSMQKKGDDWELPLYLAEGTHTYRFIADKNWITDPGNPLHLPNEHNDFNSVITIGRPHLFRLEGYASATNVILSGSFNGWRDYELRLNKIATGWELPYVLGPGNYDYKFIVDGRSLPDPANPLYNRDKTTSYLVLDPNYTFHLKGFDRARTVFLAGDFNNWTPNSLGMKKENGDWVFSVHLSPGKHLYKFIVDGEWILDPGNKLWERNGQSTGNSVLWIEK